MRSALTLVLGILLAAAAPGLRAQAKPATPPDAKPAPPAAGKAAPQTGKPATPAAKKPAAKPATAKVAKAPKPAKPVETAVNPDAPKEGEETKSSRRDPFESLVSRQQAQARNQAALPPGKAGLQVSTLRLDGIVKAPNGMIAVVTNPQARTYFLREGDQLYDGRVEKIAMDGVSFHEMGKDAFGKPVERQVNKRIYSSPGEQQ
jgi:Tfp pilus assembly protein PilP